MGFSGQGKINPPSIGRGSGPKPGSFRAKEAAAERQEAPASRPSSPASSSGGPSGYGDALLWGMAEEFERQAYDNRVSLGGRGVPYIYRALAQSVDRAQIRTLKYTDGDSRPVSATEFGLRLVRFYWNHAPWDRDGDVLAQFADPVMFEDCRDTLVMRWDNRRVHKALQARMKTSEPSPMRRTNFKTPVGYKHRNTEGS